MAPVVSQITLSWFLATTRNEQGVDRTHLNWQAWMLWDYASGTSQKKGQTCGYASLERQLGVLP